MAVALRIVLDERVEKLIDEALQARAIAEAGRGTGALPGQPSRQDWKTINRPFGAQSAPPAFRPHGVSCRTRDPSESITNSACMSCGLARVFNRVNTMRVPSGDHFGS